MSRVRNPRALLAAAVVIVAVVLGVAVLPGLGGNAGDTNGAVRVVRATLTLEEAEAPDSGRRELLVTLPGTRLNRLELTGGTPVVWLRCFDGSGGLAVRRPIDWPLRKEEGSPPHIHHPAGRRLLDRIRRCRLTGPGIVFEGRVTGRLPVAE